MSIFGRISFIFVFFIVLIMALLTAALIVKTTWKPLWDLVLRRAVAVVSFGQWASFTVGTEEGERDEFVSPYTGEITYPSNTRTF